MNYLLMLYLTFIRGPQVMREKAEQEERERLAKEAINRKNGIVPTCKKCDAEIDAETSKAPAPREQRGKLCRKCLNKEIAAIKAAQRAQQAEYEQEVRMTPFLWFQLGVMMLGLFVFLYRNVPTFFL